MKFKTFQEALVGGRTFIAANDNKPKAKQPRYSGTLPALRWLWDNHPNLAPALAQALPRPTSNWFIDVEPTKQEIRPTVGELIMASHDQDGTPLPVTAVRDTAGVTIQIGALKFRDGRLTEWGVTKKGKKLKPTDRPKVAAEKATKARNLQSYIKLRSTTPSPLSATHLHRPISTEPALAPMYDPLPGVEDARRLLQQFGIDGDAKADQLPAGVTICPDAIADGASFLSGVSNPSGNSSSGAVMWEAPEERKSDAAAVIEEVAARGTLKSIGIRLGYSAGYADRAGKAALVEVAEILASMSKNKKVA